MNDTHQKLQELNEEIVKTFSTISSIKPQPWHLFFSKQYNNLEDQLLSYRILLDEIDHEIEPHAIIPNDFNSIQMVSGKLSIIYATRNMTLTSLAEAQKLLTNSQSQASFKFTTIVSLAAIVISIFGVVC